MQVCTATHPSQTYSIHKYFFFHVILSTSLNSIQYSLCRIVQRTSRFSREHMSPHLRSLHWLPVKQRITFKWCLLIFKTLKFGLPPYFSPYFVPYTCKISTRRSAPSKHLLSHDVVPFNRNIHKSKLQFDNSFAASGPLVWNSLPEKVRCCDSLYTFRRQLKGHLFHSAFPT